VDDGDGDCGTSETVTVGDAPMTDNGDGGDGGGEMVTETVTDAPMTMGRGGGMDVTVTEAPPDDKVYEIDRVVAIKGTRRNRTLTLRWKGYGPEEDSDRKEQELRQEIVPTLVDRMIQRYFDEQQQGQCDTVTASTDVSDDSVVKEPRSLKEALTSVQRSKWLPACQRELNNLTSTGTIRILSAADNIKKPLKTRFVFKQKVDPQTGTVSEWKARLVVKGYMEDATGLKKYSPVTSAETVRSLLSVTAKNDWPILKVVDFSAAFLQAPLERDVTVQLPFNVNDQPVQATLSRALYGLADAPSLWNGHLHSALTEMGLTRSQWDTCLYVKNGSNDGGTDDGLMVALWVDDMLVSGSEAGYKQLIEHLHARKFKFKELGDARVFLGLEIERDRDKGTIEVSQRGYIGQMLEDFGMANCKARSVPISPGAVLSRDQCPTTEQQRRDMAGIPYGALIGKLIHLAKWSRGDICVAVSTLAKYTLNPGMPHWMALKGVLRYLKGTQDLTLCYGGPSVTNESDELLVFSDANLGSSEETRKSTSGFVNMYGGAAVTWGSSTQTLTALSTLQAEGVAASLAVQRGIHTRRVLSDMGVKHPGPSKVLVDNQGLQTMVANRNENGPRAKYYDLKYFYLLDQTDTGAVQILFVRTDMNLADQFTKLLPKVTLAEFRNQILGHQPMEYAVST